MKKKQSQKNIEIQNNELQQTLVTEQNDMQIVNALNQRSTAQKSISLKRSISGLNRKKWKALFLKKLKMRFGDSSGNMKLQVTDSAQDSRQ